MMSVSALIVSFNQIFAIFQFINYCHFYFNLRFLYHQKPQKQSRAKIKDGMAMIRQLNQPTFFLTLFVVESHWTPLLLILYKVAHPKDSC